MCMDKIIKHKNAYIDAFKKGVTGVENNVLYPNVDSTSPYYTELNEEQEVSSFAYEVGKTLKGNIGGSGGGDNSGTTIPNHNHDDRYAKIVHDHDGRYYTKIQIDEWRDRLINGDLLFNKINSNHIQAGTIVAGSTIIANGAIGDAQINKVSADKLDAGVVDTSKITISGANGNLKLRGNRLQVFEGIGSKQFERVSLGDVNDDGTVYGLRVRGADGQTILYDENGVYREGITDGSINNDKIAGDANIDGGKLNIHSVIDNINKDGTGTIHGTKIDIDGESVTSKIFNIELNQDEQSETIKRQQSEINQNKEQIKLKVSNQKYTEDMASMTSKLEKAESDIEILNEGIKLTASKTEVQNQINNLKDFVSEELGDISVGGTNYLNNSAPRKATVDDLITWDRTLNGTRKLTYWQDYNDSVENPEIGYHPHIDLETFHFPCIALINRNAKFSMANRELSLRQEINNEENIIIPNEQYVISFDAYSDTSLFSFHGGLYHKNVESNNYNYHSGRMDITISQDNIGTWKRYSYSFTTHKGIDTSEPIYFVINGHNNPEGSGYIKNIKLEKGHIVSQWTPSQTDSNDSLNDVVNDMKDFVNKSISEYNTSIDVKFDGITQSVSKIDKTVNGVKNDLSNLEIGARNLVKNSAFIDGKNNWILGTNVIIDTTKTFNGHPSCKSAQKGLASNGYRGCENYNLPNKNCLSMKKGEIYTVSCWYYVEDKNTFNGILALECKGKLDNNTSNSVIMRVSVDKTAMVEGQWTKIFKTITVDKDYSDVCVRAWVGKDGIAWFTDFKLEKGNKSTDWSPAPDDMKDYVDKTIINQNASIDIKFDKITSRVESTEETVNGVNQKYTELKQTVDGFNFTGLVKFEDLSKLGGTVINGGNIATGTIDTNRVNIKGGTTKKIVIGNDNYCVYDGAETDINRKVFVGFRTNSATSVPSVMLGYNGINPNVDGAVVSGGTYTTYSHYPNNDNPEGVNLSYGALAFKYGANAIQFSTLNMYQNGDMDLKSGAGMYFRPNLRSRGNHVFAITDTSIGCRVPFQCTSSIYANGDITTDRGLNASSLDIPNVSINSNGIYTTGHIISDMIKTDSYRFTNNHIAFGKNPYNNNMMNGCNWDWQYCNLVNVKVYPVALSLPTIDEPTIQTINETQKDTLSQIKFPEVRALSLEESAPSIDISDVTNKEEITTNGDVDLIKLVYLLVKDVQELKQENEELKKLIKGEI